MANQFLMAIVMLFFYKTIRFFLSRKISFLYTSILGVATPIFVHSKYMLPEPILMLAISGAIYFYFKSFYSKNTVEKDERTTNESVSKVKDKQNISLFVSGLFIGFSLLTRPDAPILWVLFSLLVLLKFYIEYFKETKNKFLTKSFFYLLGVLIFSLFFAVSNFVRYGSITETGYTIDRDVMMIALENNIQKLKIDQEDSYKIASKLYSKDKESAETKEAIYELNLLKTEFDSKNKYLEETKKNIEKYGVKPNTIDNNGFTNYLYGVYLTILNPNRSILFLSPVLIFLFFGIRKFYSKFKSETIVFAMIFFAYLTLYSLRAPLSYAGSAAWGVRYILPMYLFFGLFFIGLGDYTSLFDKKWNKLKISFYSLFLISIIFQFIGSSINYQSVQMPLEYACKQKYGTSDMTWAHESRKQLMTTFSASLLLNNVNVLNGTLPSVLQENLPSSTILGIKSNYEKTAVTGPNDWFFYELFFPNSDKNQNRLTNRIENKGSYKFFFIILIGLLISSSYMLLRKLENE